MPLPKRKSIQTSLTAHSLKILFVVSFLLLLASYSLNIFSLGLPGFFSSYQKDSESLVVNEVSCHIIHQKDLFGGMLVSLGGTSSDFAKDYASCSSKIFAGYVSQFNIQGKIITFFAPHSIDHLGIYLKIVKLISTVLFTAAVSCLVVFIAKEFSLVAGTALLLGLAISDWMVFMARNLYWMPILLFAPFIFSFGYYQKFKSTGKPRLFYLILGALVALKALAGYEYITCVILSAFAPVLYFEIKAVGKIAWKKLSFLFAKIILIGIAGFFLAVLLHIAQLSIYFHSIQHGLDVFQNRAIERTVGQPGDDIILNLIPQSKYIEPDLYFLIDNFYYLPNFSHDSANFMPLAIIFQILIFLYLNLFTFPIALKQPLASLLESVLFSVILTALISWIWHQKKLLHSSPQHLALVTATVFGLLSSLSWLVLAHPHVTHHLHLAGIVYYIPYAIFFYILLGVTVDAGLKKLKSLIYEK